MRRPNILSIHAMTTFNALRYIYDTSGVDETRRLRVVPMGVEPVVVNRVEPGCKPLSRCHAPRLATASPGAIDLDQEIGRQ
jgi:hypothetical protein